MAVRAIKEKAEYLVSLWKTASAVFKRFPEGCKTGNELSWMLKGNCAACIDEPLQEHLSVYEYREKFPPSNKIKLGKVNIYLCDKHLEDLREKILEFYRKDDGADG